MATEVDLWGISKHMAFEPGVGEGQLGREKQTVAKDLPSKKWGHLKDKTSLSPRGSRKGESDKMRTPDSLAVMGPDQQKDLFETWL